MKFDIEQWLKQNTEDLQGKAVAITGATGKLGREVVRNLLRVNAKVIMLAPSMETLKGFREELLKDFPQAEIICIEIDLNQIKSVNTAIAQIVDQRLDCLILNAAVYQQPMPNLQLGYNHVFQINFVSQYYLMRQLLPALQRTKGKVVAVSSLTYDSVALDETDIDYSEKGKKLSKVYANSKRFLTLALSEFFCERDDVSLSLVHPGITLTPVTNANNNFFVKVLYKIVFQKPEIAALNIVRGVFAKTKNDEWIGPKKANIWGLPEVKKLPESTPEERAKIYNLAEGMVKQIEKSQMLS